MTESVVDAINACDWQWVNYKIYNKVDVGNISKKLGRIPQNFIFNTISVKFPTIV